MEEGESIKNSKERERGGGRGDDGGSLRKRGKKHQPFLINIHFPRLSCCYESGCCITKQRVSDPK